MNMYRGPSIKPPYYKMHARACGQSQVAETIVLSLHIKSHKVSGYSQGAVSIASLWQYVGDPIEAEEHKLTPPRPCLALCLNGRRVDAEPCSLVPFPALFGGHAQVLDSFTSREAGKPGNEVRNRGQQSQCSSLFVNNIPVVECIPLKKNPLH